MGNRERLTRLRYLGEQLGLPPVQRNASLLPALRSVLFDINVVLDGITVAGSFCPRRCCLIGAATLDPWFNDCGLTHSLPFGDEGQSGDERCAPVLSGKEVSVSGQDLAQWFDLPPNVYESLVTPAGYYEDRDDDPTSSDVIARLDEILDRSKVVLVP